MPSGIGELKNLQTLTKIIVGGDDGFAITELKKLKNIHGKTSIEGLDQVKDASYARDTNLSLNRITELELKWGDVFDCSRNESVEKEVLGELKPHNDNLKKLGIKLYGGIEFPNWVRDPSFLQLVHISINGCRKCSSLPSLAQLPCLKKLYVEDMDEVKVVGSELLGATGVAFPSLEILEFKNMKGWKVWSTYSGVMFPRLRNLHVENCPKLAEVSFESLPLLRVLKIRECGDGVLRSIVRTSSSISKLDIRNISGLTDEAWNGVIGYLGAVKELTVYDCNEIRYLWESEAQESKVLVNLRKLHVSDCSKLASLGEKDEEEINCGSNLLTSLRKLDIWNCESMKHCICGNSIESLTIMSCSSMTYVSFPTTTATGGEQKQNLKSLRVHNCKNLLIKELGGEENTNSSSSRKKMAMLQYVIISSLENLKSVTELSYPIHLTRLEIRNCKSLESFQDRELLNLTSLKTLQINNCPSINASFPGGNWPPKLCKLEIGRLKKPISQWGPQNFPTSLVELELDGGGDEECKNISQLSHILPASLTSLVTENFVKLETVSKGLQHLTFLQHLAIYECPRIKDLPEKLLPSLLSLKIFKCPLLEERSDGIGSYYWPLISHIPEILI